MNRKTLLVGIAGIVASTGTVGVGNGDAVATSPEMVTFRAVDTDDGPRVQIEVGGLTIQAKQFTMPHEGGASTIVNVVDGRVDLRGPHGNRLRARSISTTLRGGMFDYVESSRRDVDEAAGTLIESLLPE